METKQLRWRSSPLGILGLHSDQDRCAGLKTFLMIIRIIEEGTLVSTIQGWSLDIPSKGSSLVFTQRHHLGFPLQEYPLVSTPIRTAARG